MKSNPSLIEKSKIFHPCLSEDLYVTGNDSSPPKASKMAKELYDHYWKNRRGTKLLDRRRRILPIVTDIDIPIDLRAFKSSISNVKIQSCEQSESYSGATESVKCDSQYQSNEGNRSSLHDVGNAEGFVDEERVLDEVNVEAISYPLTSLPAPIAVQVSKSSHRDVSSETDIDSVSCDMTGESILESERKHTPYIYCRYSNFPK